MQLTVHIDDRADPNLKARLQRFLQRGGDPRVLSPLLAKYFEPADRDGFIALREVAPSRSKFFVPHGFKGRTAGVEPLRKEVPYPADKLAELRDYHIRDFFNKTLVFGSLEEFRTRRAESIDKVMDNFNSFVPSGQHKYLSDMVLLKLDIMEEFFRLNPGSVFCLQYEPIYNIHTMLTKPSYYVVFTAGEGFPNRPAFRITLEGIDVPYSDDVPNSVSHMFVSNERIQQLGTSKAIAMIFDIGMGRHVDKADSSQ